MTIYGGAYRGTPDRPNANPILAAMRDDDVKHDPWGTAMGWAFGVCEYLHHVALADEAIPASLGYQPAAVALGEFDDDSYPDGELVHMGLDTFTLSMAARCLSRYLDWCKAAGRDYYGRPRTDSPALRMGGSRAVWPFQLAPPPRRGLTDVCAGSRIGRASHARCRCGWSGWQA